MTKLEEFANQMIEQGYSYDSDYSMEVNSLVFWRDGEVRLFNPVSLEEEFDNALIPAIRKIVQKVEERAKGVTALCLELEKEGFEFDEQLSEMTQHLVMVRDNGDFWMFGKDCEHYNEPEHLWEIIRGIKTGDIQVIKVGRDN